MKKMFNEGNQIHNLISSSGSGTVINYGSGSGSDFLTSYGPLCVTSELVETLSGFLEKFQYRGPANLSQIVTQN